MKIIFCGTRGSTPAPGPEFVRYGGQTSCVAIVADDASDPTLILDGGTGLRRLTTMLGERPFHGTVLIGHLHWDHTHGLPFFRSGDQEGSRVRVLIPEQGDASEVMARAIAPPHFPVRLEELRGDWSVAGIEPGTHAIEGFSVTALEVPHKASRTFGFRVSDGAATVAYVSDHAPQMLGEGPEGFGPYHDAIRALCDGVDLLIHDAQYTAEEFAVRSDFGHSSIDYCVGLAETCGARTLMLFHHDPDRTDDQLDAILAGIDNGKVEVRAAADGMTVSLP